MAEHIEERVFIVNSAGHDFTAAHVWGQIIPILKGNVNIKRPDRMMYNIFKTLKDNKFRDEDYILLSGNAFSNVVTALAIVNKFKVQNLRILIYDATTGEYVPQQLNIKTMHFERLTSTYLKKTVFEEVHPVVAPGKLIPDNVKQQLINELNQKFPRQVVDVEIIPILDKGDDDG
jgi:hypothetical protein